MNILHILNHCEQLYMVLILGRGKNKVVEGVLYAADSRTHKMSLREQVCAYGLVHSSHHYTL